MTALIIIALLAVAAYYVSRKPRCPKCGGKMYCDPMTMKDKCDSCGY